MRNPELAIRFRRVINADGTFRKAQRLPAHARASYLRGHFQVFERLHGRARS